MRQPHDRGHIEMTLHRKGLKGKRSQQTALIETFLTYAALRGIEMISERFEI